MKSTRCYICGTASGAAERSFCSHEGLARVGAFAVAERNSWESSPCAVRDDCMDEAIRFDWDEANSEHI
jgi:hypothetical protein